MLIYDQHCAADARRQRKRGTLPTRPTRVIINEAVCEGCGDCGVKCNCLSVQPVDTEFGRKTRIDQTSCNTDYSCLDGDCPSFVTVEIRPRQEAAQTVGLRSRRRCPTSTSRRSPATHNIFLAGIGGTGIVTVNQVLAMAALRAGYDVEGLDQIGLSQKAGPVVSHLRFAAGKLRSVQPAQPRAAPTASWPSICWPPPTPRTSDTATPARTISVASTSKTPTGEMVYDKPITYPETAYLLNRLGQVSRSVHSLDALAAAAAAVRQHGRSQLPARRGRLSDWGTAASGGSRSKRPSNSTALPSRPTSPRSAGDASPSPIPPTSTTWCHPRGGRQPAQPPASVLDGATVLRRGRRPHLTTGGEPR